MSTMENSTAATAAKTSNKPGWLAIILPGFLIAATGIGAGDLATASFTGSQLGVAILWAVVAGGVLKYILTEGLARWQLATGETFLEGVASRFGPVVGWLFVPYLLLWSFFVGSALMSACGVTLHALVPIFDDAGDGKIVFGILCSLLGLLLVKLGGFNLFEKAMGFCIGLMFMIVMITAALLWPGTEAVLQGLFIPSIPDQDGSGITWTVALMGGIGGTLTMLCYGYWIREKGRSGSEQIGLCRIDLGVGYLVTIAFGLAMVIIGSTIDIDGRGAGLLVSLAQKLEEKLGPVGGWLFLIGAFGAVFSSLLGVWQAIPYLFADLWQLFFNKKKGDNPQPLTETRAYHYYLVGLAVIPMLGLLMSFKEVQKLYAVVGALLIPLLAVALLVMNGKKAWVGSHSNGWLTTVLLVATLVFFGAMGWLKWAKLFGF